MLEVEVQAQLMSRYVKGHQLPMCGAHSKRIGYSKTSYMICTNDAGHLGEHTACDGAGHVLARWKTGSSSVDVWLPGVGMVRT